jgi:hypothetical protein
MLEVKRQELRLIRKQVEIAGKSFNDAKELYDQRSREIDTG